MDGARRRPGAGGPRRPGGALLVFFLAFVWFAIDWLLLIMR